MISSWSSKSGLSPDFNLPTHIYDFLLLFKGSPLSIIGLLVESMG
jgi:hypothetical protein